MMGLPVSAVTFNPQDQPIEFFASAGLGSLCVVTVVVLRLYLVRAHPSSYLLIGEFGQNFAIDVGAHCYISSENIKALLICMLCTSSHVAANAYVDIG